MVTKTTIEMAREAAGDDWGLFQEYMPEIHRLAELVRADERARMAEQPTTTENNGGKTGWPPGLLQDDCKGLSKWLSNRPDAKRRVREALAEQPAQQQTMYLESGGLGYGRAPERKLIIGYVNKSEQPVKPTVKQSLTVEPAQQKRGVWPCVIAEADFEHDTITLEMQCSDYKVGAGQHWLSTSPPAQRKPLTPEWIWTWLMDWCKRNGSSPANYNSLFKMVADARAIEAAHGIKGDA